MQEPFSKDRLLEAMRTGFAAFESFLAPLSEEQMTTPGVNDAWSVKDNLAHLAAWQWHALRLLQAVKDHVAPVDQYEGLTEEQQNERIYQQNKDRPLSEVQSEFRSSFEQVLAGVHGLTPRLNRENFVEIVTRTGGIQAQVMSAAELALFTRVEGLSPQDVRSALWQDRILIKTWAMRGTLHLLPASELPLYVAARDWHATPAWSNYFAEFGLTTPAQQESFLSAVPHVLEQGPMTRQQLADALAKHTGISKVRDLIIGANWGSPLKPSAYRGDLCFGPSQGQSVTFVNPKT